MEKILYVEGLCEIRLEACKEEVVEDIKCQIKKFKFYPVLG